MQADQNRISGAATPVLLLTDHTSSRLPSGQGESRASAVPSGCSLTAVSVRLFDLDAEAVEQFAGGALDGGDGALIADEALHVARLGLLELCLGVQDEEDRLAAEFVLALLRFKIFPRQIARDLTGGDGKFGLLELVHGVPSVEVNRLLARAQGIKVSLLVDLVGGIRGFRGAVADGQPQLQCESVPGKIETKDLAEAVGEAPKRNDRGGRYGSVDLIAAQAVRGVDAGKIEVRLETVMGQADAGVIAGKLLAQGFELRPLLKGLFVGLLCVYGKQFAGRLGRLDQFEIERAHVGIKVRSDGKPERVLGLSERILGLNHRDSPRGDLGLGTVDVEGRERAQLQRTFIMIVTGLGGLERFAQYVQVLAGLHDIPIRVDHRRDGVVHLPLEIRARLRQIAPRDHNWRAIDEEPAVAQQRLAQLEIQTLSEHRVECVEA